MRTCVLRLWVGLCLTSIALSQSRPIAVTGARLIPISGPEIANGVLVVQGGKIVAAGPSGSVAIPANAERIDATGKVVMPGLVDSHSHIGAGEGADSSAPIQPDIRLMDSVNPRNAQLRKAAAGGVTTVNIMPGSGHLLSGQTLYIKLRPANTVDDLLITLPGGRIAGGMKMANGTNSRRATPFPGTRAKSAALVREQFIKAQEYRDKIASANGDVTKLPARDLRLEGLVEVLDGKRIVQFHSHRNDDIMTALRLSQEFHFKLVIHHGSEAWMVASELAKAKVPVSMIVIDSPGGKLETKDAKLETGAILETAGVLVGIHTDDGITDSRLLFRNAAIAVRAGMSRDGALKAITINNAKILDLDSRVGTLEVGKDADFLLLSGDPFSTYTHVLQTWIDGAKVFDRDNAADRLYAVGGYGASHDQPRFDLDDEETR